MGDSLEEVKIHIMNPDAISPPPTPAAEATTIPAKKVSQAATTNSIHQIHVPLHLKFDQIKVKAGEKEILHDVSGEFKPGEMVAIMGPSGAGKSTLLNFLAGRSKGMELAGGEILINGQKPTKNIRRRIGYVLQEDVFFSHLTVNQTLKFVGEIRLPDSLSKVEKCKMVDEVIDELGLRKCAETVMGGGMFVTGCSGGEKKRCSIATELITNPSLLMMDEPTSGLDSSTAFNLMQTLKKLAQDEQRTIVTTIHQPSSHVFHMFDKLILVAGGRLAYFGKTSEVLNFFEHIGTPCYANWNPADFIMEQLTGDPEEVGKIAVKFADYQSLIEEKQGVKVGISPKTNGHTRKKKFSVFKNGFAKDDEDAPLAKWPTGFRTQFNALCQRAFIQSKQEMLDKLGFVQTFGLALIVSLLWFNTPYDEESLGDRQGVIFFLLVFTNLHPMFHNVMSYPTERATIQKERAAGMYRLSAYYFAKLVSEIPALLLQPLTLYFITYWATGLNRSPYFLVAVLTIATGAFLSQTIGLVIGTSSKSLKRALTITVLTALGTMLLGGFYTKRVPTWMTWARYVSMFTYSFNILVRVEFDYAVKDFSCDVDSAFSVCSSMANNATSLGVLTGKDILPTITTVDLGIIESFVALWAMIALWRVIFYLSLKYLNKP